MIPKYSKSHIQLNCSVVSDSATLCTAARQASLCITNFQLMSTKSMMPSNHFILCCPLLLPPSIFPSTRVFFNESALHIGWPKYWLRLHQSFQWIVSVDFLYDWLVWSPCSPRDSQESSPAPQFEKHQFFFIETHSHSFFHVAHFCILQLIASKRLQFLQ